MKITAMVEFLPPKTQAPEPTLPVANQNPIISMSFKTIPMVGHIVQSPNQNLPAPFYRVALIIHNIHGDIIIKVIPV